MGAPTCPFGGRDPLQRAANGAGLAAVVAEPLVWLLDGDERTRMPPAAPLAAVERDAIVAWIVAGAPQ